MQRTWIHSWRLEGMTTPVNAEDARPSALDADACIATAIGFAMRVNGLPGKIGPGTLPGFRPPAKRRAVPLPQGTPAAWSVLRQRICADFPHKHRVRTTNTHPCARSQRIARPLMTKSCTRLRTRGNLPRILQFHRNLELAGDPEVPDQRT